MALPQIVVTGSSGFLGRHLLDELKEKYRIFGIARRSPAKVGAPLHRNITWYQVDIGDQLEMATAFRKIREEGGAEIVIHLAAHYDFVRAKHPNYWRTNVEGLRNVLEECLDLRLRRFIFASSAAACGFPPPYEPARVLTEDTPADGRHIYAITKRLGEEMVEEYSDDIPTATVRFAALFSDWCEYPPLFIFLQTWLSKSWRRRMLGGRGEFAIPYLHVREAVRVVRKVMDLADSIETDSVFLACPDGGVTSRYLFEEATMLYFGSSEEPIWAPRWFCRLGMRTREKILTLLGHRPFERAWMADYIDRQLLVDARQTRATLGWKPRPRLNIDRRLPFMIENFKADPTEWYQRNHAAMRLEPPLDNLRVHRLLEKYETRILEGMSTLMTGRKGRERFPDYQNLSAEEQMWNHRVALRHVMDSVRTRDKSIYASFCRDLAELRFGQGFEADEVCEALRTLRDVCMRVLYQDPESEGLCQEIEDHITMTMLFGCDQIEDTFEQLAEASTHWEVNRDKVASEMEEPAIANEP
jgi:nucleoside-diphosphate-sugar epimerase